MSSAPSVSPRARGRHQLLALVREVGADLADCELTHVERTPVDVALAREQHEAYRAALAGLGCEVLVLPAAPGFPDAVFVEDTAVVLDEVAVLARPGAASRRGEVDAVATILAAHRPTVRIEAPATLDGGDVLVLGRSVYVGTGGRTDEDAQQCEAGAPHGASPGRGSIDRSSGGGLLRP